MLKHVSVTYRGPVADSDADVKKRLRAEVKQALQDEVVFWHDNILRHHFSYAAYSRYAGVYAPRTKKYEVRKAKKYGHRNPLEFTGRTKRDVMSRITVSGSAKAARGRMMSANRALNFGGRGKHDLRAELLAVSAPEMRQMADRIDERVQKWLNDESVSKTVTA